MILELVKVEERGDPQRVWYAAEPNIIYPFALSLIRKIQSLTWPIVGDRSLAGNIAMGQLISKAGRIPAPVFEMVRLSGDPHQLDPDDRAARAELLECARLLFTELLHIETNRRPIGLHILRRPAWRL